MLIASHNQHSIEHVLDIMDEHQLTGEASNIYFGQLLGMSDHLTFCLGQAGCVLCRDLGGKQIQRAGMRPWLSKKRCFGLDSRVEITQQHA